MKTKKWVTGVLIAGLSMVLASCSFAQVLAPEDMGLNYSLTAGAAFPVNSDVPDSAVPIIGVAWYGSAGRENFGNAQIGLSIDWTQVSRNDGEDVNLVPVLLNYKAYTNISGYRVFANIGIGIIGADDNVGSMQIENGANFGWTIGAGVDLSNNLFGQFRFLASDNPGDDGLAAFQVGYRF